MKSKNSKKVFLIFITLLFLLFFFIFLLIIGLKYQKQDQLNAITNIVVMSEAKFKTIEEIVEEHDSTYVEKVKSTIYVEFGKDLFEDGNSNEEYFEDMINDLCNLEEFETKSFKLIDEEKAITIQINYEPSLERHKIIYNNKEDFFDFTDGELYSKFEHISIIDETKLMATSKELSDLINGQMFFKSINETIGEGIDLGNGYISYQNGTILIKKVDGRVKNIIFTKDYKEEVFSGITVGTSLKEIEKEYSENVKGNSKDGYLMYRTNDIYVFFYEDEIVVYGYSYFPNNMFEDFFEQYLNNKDFKTFVEKVTKKWTNYDICEINLDDQYAHITYPSRGVDILIENNNPIGTTFYENYYFTDKTKKIIVDEQVILNDKEDFLELTEINRRSTMER